MFSKRKFTQALIYTSFVGPVFFVFSMIVLIPFVLGMYYSLTSWNGVSGTIEWNGLNNFIQIFKNDLQVRDSFLFTIKFTLASVFFTNSLGFLLALLLTQKLKAKNILRTVFFIPNLIAGLLLGFIWQFIFVKGFAAIGELTGFSLFQLPWLGDATTAFWGIVIVSVWQGAGYVMVIYIAAILNIPDEVIEAARIDGANGWDLLKYIILPLIRPAITICLFLTISWAFKIFDLNFSLTGGGPFKSTESLAINIYTEAFVNNRYGLGAAKAFLFFVVVATITTLQVLYTKKKEVEA
ncbi:sugar ABC transporter permease [Microaerobacter geothermalis]|uniref:carbohydrate ABC transporter permease n=1 Tax=Microaerobacter geothermalis TaxID=674972 RepID=UPI001F43BA58|nr:sugar ABC transporter permease [Microaerobacter geothermalis]MCF6093615.1 sugar ABC transporter permease [Microaerobacter geothermalis]